MATIKWDQISAPSFRDANALMAESRGYFQEALKGLTDTAKQVQTNVRNTNQAKILDYVNQAATAEQLQSNEYRQGYQNLLEGFDKEYDAQTATKTFDSRIDVLNQRANQELERQRTKQLYDQSAVEFGDKQSDRDLLQRTRDYFTSNDPLVKEALSTQGIDPTVLQALTTGNINIEKQQSLLSYCSYRSYNTFEKRKPTWTL